MTTAELKALKEKLDKLTLATGNGVRTGVMLYPAHHINGGALGATEAFDLMADGLRWRAALSHPMLPRLVDEELLKLADETLTAL